MLSGSLKNCVKAASSAAAEVAVSSSSAAQCRHPLPSGPQSLKHAIDRTNAATHQAALIWEVASEDFVYSVCLSPNLDICAFGGTVRALVVLNGRTGTELFRVTFPSTVWSVQLAVLPDGAKLAVGEVARCRWEARLLPFHPNPLHAIPSQPALAIGGEFHVIAT